MKNARRFQALERVGLRDRDTGAYNLAYFVDYAGKEFYKARRYARAFSLVVLSIDNAEQMRKEGGRELYRRAMRDLVGAVSRVVRDADILAKVSESEYYVLLPETDYFGALMFLRRAAEEVRREESIRESSGAARSSLSMGAATFPKDGEDFDELLHWARARVQEQRGSLLRRLHLADVPANAFWELADLLLSDHARIPESSPSARLARDAELFAAAQREAAREIGRDPRARGLLYVGTRERLALAPVVQALPPGDVAARAGDATVRVYLLGPRGAGDAAPVGHPLVTEVYLDGDKRFAGHEFLLFISEHSAYGLLAGPGRPHLPHLRRAARRRARLEAPDALRPAAPLIGPAHAPRPQDPRRRPGPRHGPRARAGAAAARLPGPRGARRLARAPDRDPPLPGPGALRRALPAPRRAHVRADPADEPAHRADPGGAHRRGDGRGPRAARHLPPQALQPGRGARPDRADLPARGRLEGGLGESREIEGNLAQIPLVDLLQILAVNRKTGRLAVEREGEKAEIALDEGRVVDARMRGAERREGALPAPHAARGAVRLRARAAPPARRASSGRSRSSSSRGSARPTRWRACCPALPQPGDVVELAVHPSEIPPGLHPVTEEVVALLAEPRTFQELVDRCRASDLEAMRAVLALLEHGYARRAAGAPPPEEAAPLLAAHELHALRARIARGRSSGAQTVGKVVARRRRAARAPGGARAVPAPSRAGSRSRGERRVRHRRPAHARRRRARGRDGAPGRPARAARSGGRSRRGRSARSCCCPADDVEPLLAELARTLRLPVVVCGPSEASVPQALRDVPAGFAFEGSDAAEGLRALLAGAGAAAAA